MTDITNELQQALETLEQMKTKIDEMQNKMDTHEQRMLRLQNENCELLLAVKQLIYANRTYMN